MIVQFEGIKEARAYVERLRDGAEAAGQLVVLVGSNLPYAYGIHEGRHRGGRLARRAGGVPYLTLGLDRVRDEIAPTIARAIPQGPSAVLGAFARVGNDVARGAVESLTSTVYAGPTRGWSRTGQLRRSIHTVIGRR